MPIPTAVRIIRILTRTMVIQEWVSTIPHPITGIHIVISGMERPGTAKAGTAETGTAEAGTAEVGTAEVGTEGAGDDKEYSRKLNPESWKK
jgi:hypothetical protein